MYNIHVTYMTFSISTKQENFHFINSSMIDQNHGYDK